MALQSPSSYNSPSPKGNVYRSTPDSRSSVLNRAREYTRRVEDEARRRSKSLDRNSAIQAISPTDNTNSSYRRAGSTASGHSYGSSRGREGNSRHSTDSSASSYNHNSNSNPTSSYNNSGRSYRSQSAGRTSNGGSAHGEGSHRRSISIRERAMASVEKETNRNTISSSYRSSGTMQEASPAKTENSGHGRHMSPAGSVRSRARSLSRSRSQSRTRRSSTGGDQPTVVQQQHQQQAPPPEEQQGEAIVSPELLVDALSGHEDGLLAIAERLMEHYDSGYDAMGEAIIDAFADVQKLFQHVVEAAHMEGAAFESSRREEEIRELKRRVASGEVDSMDDEVDANDPMSPSLSGPVRHDEFIDQDVKDCLNQAIRTGVGLKEEQQHAECFALYEQACQSASALLPVDSDHRGRLQLSIARAESMSPDRGCAILRYAMDDVLRSGLRPGKIPKNYPLSDPSKRADVVLSKPSNAPQSSEEHLNSLVEELKDTINAPVYENTPLQDVAKRFWATLQEHQKARSKNEERLEHNLGKLKGDYLLARAEWEEKLTEAKEEADLYKRKYNTFKDGKEVSLMEDARSMMSQKFQDLNKSTSDLQGMDSDMRSSSFRSTPSRPEFKRASESVASMGSNLAAHAKTLVGSFACAGNNERTGQVLSSERATEEWRDRRSTASLEMNQNGGANTNRSYRDTRRGDV